MLYLKHFHFTQSNQQEYTEGLKFSDNHVISWFYGDKMEKKNKIFISHHIKSTRVTISLFVIML